MKRLGKKADSWSVLGLVGLLVGLGPSALAEARRADVVVYGGTAGGVIAAIAAARDGKSVLLVGPGKHVGGMVSGGLGATDTGNRQAIGGYSREFFDRVRAYYVQKYGADSPQVKDCSDGFHFEPRVAEAVFRKMLEEAKVTVLPGKPLRVVRKTGTRIDSIVTDQDIYAGTVFIDASYEGDLMAKAGVSYTVGREPKSKYYESLAGVQVRSPAHQWPVPVSPRGADGQLLPGVIPGPIDVPGSGDRKVQAYNYRLCMTNVPENRVPFPKPKSYDPARYELLARYLEAKPDLTVRNLMNPVKAPNGKTDTNNNGPFSTDHIGANWDYPDADEATRAKIIQDHVDYVQGFFYFLANDPRVPAKLHEEINRWGLAKDEFVDTGNWPHQLYVREARRMIGAFVMKQADIMDGRNKEDSIGLGSYNTDSHHVQRVATNDGAVINEGDFQVGVSPYAIPYRSLVPRPTECVNLIVPVCMSASHVAYGTIRMEPVYMILGQASGVAASLAIAGKTPVQGVMSDALREKLKAQKAVLDPIEVPVAPRAARAGTIDPGSLKGIVVDDREATVRGEWFPSSAIGPYVGEGYLHDGNDAKGTKSVRFTPRIPRPGKYEVFLYSTPNANRATNVPVVIQHEGDKEELRVDERRQGGEGKPVRLGVFSFGQGDAGWVEVRTEGTDGHVVVDAAQFVPIE
jgi:hypothetical protein